MDLGAFSISLAVKDLAASRAFYEKLGFEPFAGDGEPLAAEHAQHHQVAARVQAAQQGDHQPRVIERADLRAALAQLPPPQREVLLLRGIEQLSAKATAAMLGIGVEAAHKRYQRALDRLRSRLPDREPYHVWTNFGFTTHNGQLYEVDALAITDKGKTAAELMVFARYEYQRLTSGSISEGDYNAQRIRIGARKVLWADARQEISAGLAGLGCYERRNEAIRSVFPSRICPWCASVSVLMSLARLCLPICRFRLLGNSFRPPRYLNMWRRF